MLTPQTIPVTPNALYASQVVLGSYISDGQLRGVLQSLVLNGATVDEDERWNTAHGMGVVSGLDFYIDNEGNITGLPEDLASIGPDVVELWTKLVEIIGTINDVRKVV